MTEDELTPHQKAMVASWERHIAAEFAEKDVDATMPTMTAEPFVNHVPVMTGGVGFERVLSFYARSTLNNISDPFPEARDARGEATEVRRRVIRAEVCGGITSALSH